MAPYADRRGLSRHQRRELEDQYLLGRPLPRDHIHLRRHGADSSVASVSWGHIRWSTKLLAGTLLIGFGLFNLVEGIVDHHLLGIHHVNETVPREQWIFWDVGFLTWGAAMLIGGWVLLKVGQRETIQEAADAPPR